ncbi:MAG TPA: hypothetical protein VGQ51_04415 [Puia sp.]|nr:hypothetical protein [Puia sp.]
MKPIYLLLPIALLLRAASAQQPFASAQQQQPAAARQPAAASLADYGYNIPAGWTPTQYPDGIVLSAPVSNTAERCLLQIWPMRTPSGNLAQDAVTAFRQVFSAYQPTESQYATRNSVIRGTSAQGWDYFMIKNAIRLSEGNYQVMWGFVFVAGLGNRVAVISGISKDPLVSSCFGLNLSDVWPKFFYSLRFKGWNSSLSPQQMMKRIAGSWIAVTATAGDKWVFAANGRFASASAAQRYYSISSNEAISVTDAYFGDGSWSLDGQAIVLTKDNDKARPSKGWIRLEQESYDNGNNWAEHLYLLRTSTVDGKEYEMNYHRDK